MDQSNAPAVLAVSSVPPASVAKGFALVYVNRRDSKENGTVPQPERHRSIVIPELTVPDVPSKFQSIVLAALYNAANEQLSQFWQDAGWPGLTEVPAAVWGVDNILAYAARAAESKRLSTATVTGWFASSKLRAFLVAKGDEKLLKQWEKRILGMAAPALTLSEDQCNVTIATIGKFEEDAQSIIGAQIISKLAARVKKLAEEECELEGLEIPSEEGQQ